MRARRARRAAPAEQVAALGAFGRRIGVAFQLLDDILDVAGPASLTGKHRGTDLLDGTVTLPLILARERDGRSRRWTCARSRRPSRPSGCATRIEATGALDDARARALAIVAEAKRELSRSRSRTVSGRALNLVADSVVDRHA